jgi:hypothetical protein
MASKQKPSKLDQHAERLDRWFGEEKQTIEWVREQLHLDGCDVSSGRLSEWWSARQLWHTQQRILQQITTSANQAKDVEKLFGDNPPPETETLIKLVRVLIMKFSTDANVDPGMSEVVFNMLKPVIKWHEVLLKKEALGLERQKFQRQTVELFLKWAQDTEATRIVSSNLPTQEKTERLGQKLFGDLWQ